MAPRDEYPNVRQGVRIAAEAPGEPVLQLTGVLEAVRDQGGLELRCLDELRVRRLAPGTQVTLEYFRGGVIVRLVAEVERVEPGTGSEGTASYPRVVVAPPSDVQTIQRRRYKRALVALPVTLVPVELPSTFDPDSRTSKELLTRWARAIADSGYEGTTETLSGSGLRMRVDAPTELGQAVFVQIELPDEPVRVVSEVVWAGSGYPLEAPGKALGLEFKNLTDKQRAAILAFVEGKPSV
jgi:c-di-GMP-binding flagellar brake protein YcgR